MAFYDIERSLQRDEPWNLDPKQQTLLECLKTQQDQKNIIYVLIILFVFVLIFILNIYIRLYIHIIAKPCQTPFYQIPYDAADP